MSLARDSSVKCVEEGCLTLICDVDTKKTRDLQLLKFV